MDSLSWITGHIHAFEFIGGVTRTVVPDNLQTGVEKPSPTEPIIKGSYIFCGIHATILCQTPWTTVYDRTWYCLNFFTSCLCYNKTAL